MHAAVLVINEAIDKQIPDETLRSLLNPAAMLTKVEEAHKVRYQDELYRAKRSKEDKSQERVRVFSNTGYVINLITVNYQLL